MAVKYDFKDDVTYTADDINAIRAGLVTKGIVSTDSTACKVVKESSTYYVYPGTVFFADGSSLTVTVKENIAVVTGTVKYVYAFNNPTANKNELKVTAAAMTEGDFILLATIASDGTITDNRTFSRAKYANASPVRYYVTQNITIPANIRNTQMLTDALAIPNNCNYFTAFCDGGVKQGLLNENTNVCLYTTNNASGNYYLWIKENGTLYGLNSNDSSQVVSATFIFEEVTSI